MRDRARIVESLERVYRSAFEAAEQADDEVRMSQLDLDYQRDQLYFEIMLDLRDQASEQAEEQSSGTTSLLEKAEALRRLTRLRPGI